MKRLIFAVMCVSIAVASSGEEKVVFTGQKITDPRGAYQITPEGKKEGVVFVNLQDHFGVVLPYSERWEFSIHGQHALFGHSGLVNVTVDLLENAGGTDHDFLDSLMGSLLKNKATNGTTAARIAEYQGREVVLSIVDASVVAKDDAFKRVKGYNYFATRSDGKVRLKYNLSLTVDGDKPTIDPNLLVRNATLGLNVIPR